jgi:hypothetical protein
MSEIEAKVPTAGVEFFDVRRSPMKLLEVIDHPNIQFHKGDSVCVSGGNGKVYGPYILDEEFGRGNGKILFKAYVVQAGSPVVKKPLTKAELEQELVKMQAELLALKSKGRKEKVTT